MNEFEKALAVYLGEAKLNKIQNVKVGIAGAGGLGSNCACNFLDQIGMPKVEVLKNNLLRINPALELDMIQEQIAGKNADSFFSNCDVIVEAFDKVACKTMLVEKYYNSDKLLISATGLAGWGNSDAIVVKKIHEKFYLIGDSVSEANENRPPISPRVNIAAAKQADVILEYVISENLNE